MTSANTRAGTFLITCSAAISSTPHNQLAARQHYGTGQHAPRDGTKPLRLWQVHSDAVLCYEGGGSEAASPLPATLLHQASPLANKTSVLKYSIADEALF